MTRCPDCPVADGLTCIAAWHPPYCEWARRGGVHRDHVRDKSVAGLEPPVTPTVRQGREAKPRLALGVSQHAVRR